jgi:hypothetical protein
MFIDAGQANNFRTGISNDKAVSRHRAFVPVVAGNVW